MTPDIVLSGQGSQCDRLIVLDAKYRIDEGLNDALSSIHTYRDALVREAASGAAEGIVSAAYLLTPYDPSIVAGYRDTPMPGRLFHPEYRAGFRFGAVTLNRECRRLKSLRLWSRSWPTRSGRTDGGRPHSGAAQPEYEPHPRARHQARDAAATRAARGRVALPAAGQRGSCPWTWCSFECCHRDLRRAGIDQAAMLGRLTTGLSLNVAMVSRLK